MPTPPKLTDEQRAAALEKAAQVRKTRSELKQRLKMGSISLSDIVKQAEDDEVVAKMKVLSVLESLPGIGKVSARRTMEDLGIAESRRLSGLGEKQKAALLETFS